MIVRWLVESSLWSNFFSLRTQGSIYLDAFPILLLIIGYTRLTILLQRAGAVSKQETAACMPILHPVYMVIPLIQLNCVVLQCIPHLSYDFNGLLFLIHVSCYYCIPSKAVPYPVSLERLAVKRRRLITACTLSICTLLCHFHTMCSSTMIDYRSQVFYYTYLKDCCNWAIPGQPPHCIKSRLCR